MSSGAVTISIDLELAWGNWDNLEPRHMHHVKQSERAIVKRLVALFDRHQLPVTWAFVAALLDRDSAEGRPGGEALWYAPDVIDTIRSARVRHDFGSHGGRHRYFDAMTDAEAEQELAFAKGVHDANGLELRSFVFPRNKVAKTALLERFGIKVYRGEDHASHNWAVSPIWSTRCCRSRPSR
jgi:peptidoglycan/xylan/chitin deacetylase (PgdA/CDA1 family)